jgi:DNA-3-methyladenine glycosylase II
MLLATPTELKRAQAHLIAADDRLASIIATDVLAAFTPHTNYYHALVGAIIGQQLSVKAAATITGRFKDLFGGSFPEPAVLVGTSFDNLRRVGLSGQKAHYIRDLADHILDGRISFQGIPQQSNREVIDMLTDVKGIGEWTVHMFLMFCVGRLDILPTGDLGVRTAIRNLYQLPQLPTAAEVRFIAETHSWQPYASVASWYLWRSLDNKPV